LIVRQKTTKNLRRALAILLTFGPLVGLSAAPAMASDHDRNFDIDILVTDTTCYSDYTDPSWGPYLDISGMTTEVDLADRMPVDFEVTLAFFAGMDNNACGLGDQPPSGDVHSVLTLPAGLGVGTVECDLDVANCDALGLFNSGGLISGSINVASDAATGPYTATLQVVWTPEN